MAEDRFAATRRLVLRRGLLAPFTTLMLVCGVLVYHFSDYLRDRVEHDLVRTAASHRRLIDQFLEERTTDLIFASAAHGVAEIASRAKLEGVFRNLQACSRAFLDLGVIGEDGRHLAYVGPYDLAGRDYSKAEWFRRARADGIYVSDVFLGYRKSPHFVIAVRGNEGGRSWYLRATIDTLFFNDLVESIRIGETGEAYLVARNGVLQTKRRSGGVLMAVDMDFHSYTAGAENAGVVSARGASGGRYLYVVRSLEKTGWLLVVRQERGDAYGPLTRAVGAAIILVLTGGTAAVAVAYLMATGVANRLSQADLEKQHMTTQLVMAGKLAEVGEMSAGLAHEINNPLQVMKSEEAMIRELLADLERSGASPAGGVLERLKDSAGQIGLQIDRCKRITQQLLGFARKKDSVIQPVQMREFLPQVVGMVERKALVENVKLVQEYASDLPSLRSDPNQLQQVFLNLLNNAMYALRGRTDGEIRISVIREDGFVKTTVTDNGCGIPPENIGRIFIPFFTTKPAGQGTGLGLSTAYGIVKNLGGSMSVTSELNAGAAFVVSLPLELPGEGQRTGA